MQSTLARRALLALATIASLSLAAAPALAETARGNGVMKTETRQVTGFTGVGLSVPGKLEVKLGPTESVTIEADENLLALIETTVKGGELEIRPIRRNLNFDAKAIRIVVQAKSIDSLSIGGSGSISAEQLRGGKMKLDIGGSGSIDVKRLDAERLEIAIGGSGDIKAAGAVKSVAVSIGGSGDVTAQNLVADNADVTIAGSGDTSIAVRTKLDVTIVGAGAVSYWGDPQLKRTVLGSGSIKRLGALPQ